MTMWLRTNLHTGAVVLLLAAGCTPQERPDSAVQPAGGTIAAAAGGDAASTTEAAMSNQLTDAQRQAGWRLLFDGRTLDGWRGYGQQEMPAGWQVVDGELTRVSRARDIITVDQFTNFELELEWKTVAGGNSGIFYRAIEGPDPIYHYAPEYQILDDEGHGDGRNELTSAGSNYGLHAPPAGVVRPVGEWNTARIVVNGNRVEHWMNGQQVVQYVLGDEDWERRVAASKFAAWPQYGRAPRGHIGLQEHGSWVAFRNIRIRELP